MKLLHRINAWGKRNMGWLLIIMGTGFVMWLFEPPSNVDYLIEADGKSYHCSRYEMDKFPFASLSVDDKGTTSVVITPSYNFRLYDWKPHRIFRVLVAEFNCKTYQVHILTDATK